MRKIGDVMKDLGFREDGSDETKKAFIKNLIKAASAQPRSNPAVAEAEKMIKREDHGFAPTEQLSFSFETDETVRVEARKSS